MAALEQTLTVTVAIGSTGFATYSNAQCALDFSGAISGLEAYAVTVSGNVLSFQKITGAVPPNTGMLLSAPAAGNYLIPVAVAGEAPEHNDLVSTNIALDTSNYNYYALAALTDGVDFKLAGGEVLTTPKTNKAYLQVAKGSETRQFVIGINGGATGISATLINKETMDNEVYNLQGQRIVRPLKGLYIMRGKKVIVK